jgi:hypothetical protein
LLKMDQKEVHCFVCQQDVSEGLGRSEESGKKDKVAEVYEKIIQQS